MKIKHPSPSSEAYFLYLERIFSVPVPYLKEIISSFHSEMERGLSGKKSSLKMLPSFVDTAKGKETGEFMALESGGHPFQGIAGSSEWRGKVECFRLTSICRTRNDNERDRRSAF